MSAVPAIRITARITIAAGLLTLAACSGGGDASPPAPSVPPTTTGASPKGTPTTAKPSVTTTAPAGSSTTIATSTPTPPVSNPAWSAEQQAVADAYLRATTAFDQASATVNTADPGLSETMTGSVLNKARVSIANLSDNGEAARLPPNSKRAEIIKTVEVQGASAVLTGCTIDDAVVYKIATGEVVNDNVVTVHFNVTMTYIDGTWKLSERGDSNKRPGVQPCA